MIARKIKPGVLEIIDAKSQDEIESYALLEITDRDAYLLLTSTRDFRKDGNVTTINYTNGDDVDKMFKAIAKKHKEENPTNFVDVSRKYKINEDIGIPGTSLFIRDPKTHVIKVCYRKTANSKVGNINRLFVDNKTRDEFFDDVRKGKRHLQTGKWELDTQDAREYAFWSAYMNDQYFKIMTFIKWKTSNKR